MGCGMASKPNTCGRWRLRAWRHVARFCRAAIQSLRGCPQDRPRNIPAARMVLLGGRIDQLPSKIGSGDVAPGERPRERVESVMRGGRGARPQSRIRAPTLAPRLLSCRRARTDDDLGPRGTRRRNLAGIGGRVRRAASRRPLRRCRLPPTPRAPAGPPRLLTSNNRKRETNWPRNSAVSCAIASRLSESDGRRAAACL